MDTNDFTSFLATSGITGKGLAEESIRRIVSNTKVYLAWLQENNLDFNKPSVEAFLFLLKNRHKASNTLNAYRNSLVCYEAYLNDRGAEIHFMYKFRSYGIERATPLEILTLEEIRRLISTRLNHHQNSPYDLSYVEDTNNIMLKFLVYTGARIGGATNLMVKDIDFDMAKARFRTKGNRIHEVFLLDPFFSEFKAYLKKYNKKPTDLAFSTSTGHKINKSNFGKYIKAIAKKAEINKNVHPHTLRHCFTSLMKAQGADIADISKLLGHKNISTTFANYLQYFDTSLKKILEKYHPLMREGLTPEEKLKLFLVMIREFGIIDDPRFNTLLKEAGNGITFEAWIKC